MKKLALILGLVLVVGVGVAAAENSKVTVQVRDGLTLAGDYGTWSTILKQTIKTVDGKSIIVNPSLVCNLFTFTKVSSKGGDIDTEWAYGAIRVRVALKNLDTDEVTFFEPDGGTAENGVVYSRRLQAMQAKFSGIITRNPDGTYLQPITEEEFVSLLLLTSDAHSFNFLATDVRQGNYEVQVQARLVRFDSGLDATAFAWIGKSAVTIEEVRLIKDPAEPYVINP